MKHLLVQQEAHRLCGPQEPGRHLLHELSPPGSCHNPANTVPLQQLVIIAGLVLHEPAPQGGVQDAHRVGRQPEVCRSCSSKGLS